ncbi:MAG: hypothetical protein ACREE7_03835, partial [Dongiaceae bacterium]
MTEAEAAASCFSAAIARSARDSCTKPMTAFRRMMPMITRVSLMSPTSPETTAAPIRTRIMKSANWPRN